MRDLLPLLVSGRLAAADEARVNAHVKGCADCAAEVELLRAVGRAYPARQVDVATIAAKLPVRRRGGAGVPFYRQPLWRVAASLTLFIAGTATLMVVRGRAPEIGTPVAALPAVPDTGTPATSPETTLASSAPSAVPQQGRGTPSLSLGADLSGLTDAQLQALLTSLDRLDSRPQADPTTLATPIIQDRVTAPGRSNQ
jgi:hypothetical protein